MNYSPLRAVKVDTLMKKKVKAQPPRGGGQVKLLGTLRGK